MINWPANVQQKKNAFVILGTDHGTMIVNRFDDYQLQNGNHIGVSFNLLQASCFDPAEMNIMIQILMQLRNTRGDGVVMLDGGANIGAHSLIAGRTMQGWGKVIAFEAQERVFYALAGNIAINNLFNVRANCLALDQTSGIINIPVPDYLSYGSFGSMELIQNSTSEFIGQTLTEYTAVNAVTIDSLNLNRLDFLKLDVEGMEDKVLIGATNTISQCKPIILLEHFKNTGTALTAILDSFGYNHKQIDHVNTLAIHKTDQIKFD